MLPDANKGGTYNCVPVCIQAMTGRRYKKLVKAGEPREESMGPRVCKRITVGDPVTQWECSPYLQQFQLKI